MTTRAIANIGIFASTVSIIISRLAYFFKIKAQTRAKHRDLTYSRLNERFIQKPIQIRKGIKMKKNTISAMSAMDLPPPPPPPPLRNSRKTLIIIIVIVVIAVAAVPVGVYLATSNGGSSPFVTPTATPSFGVTPTPSATAASSDAGFVKYKTASYVDTQGIGTEAFSLLIPSDWQFEGSINWVLDNPGMPATANIRVWNPQGTEEFDVFPNQAFFWTDNALIQQTNPPGSTYFGALVRSPLDPIDALKEIALPLFRGNVENLNVVSEQEVPEMDQLFQTGTDPTTGISSSADSAKIRVEYSLNGVMMEDEMYCVIQSLKIPQQSIYGTTTNNNWYMTYLASFRAEKGKLDSESKVFQTIAFSTKTDKNWLNKYNQLVYYLIQNQIHQIQSIGQLSNMLSQMSNEISDQNLKDWEQRQNVNDQLVKDFCNQILEIQPYNNPIDGSTVDLPSGYTSVWTNSLGEYVLGESPSFNPNIGSNMNWQPMTATTG
jgi:hypothetical protein